MKTHSTVISLQHNYLLITQFQLNHTRVHAESLKGSEFYYFYLHYVKNRMYNYDNDPESHVFIINILKTDRFFFKPHPKAPPI